MMIFVFDRSKLENEEAFSKLICCGCAGFLLKGGKKKLNCNYA